MLSAGSAHRYLARELGVEIHAVTWKVTISQLQMLRSSHHALLLLHIWDHLLGTQIPCPTARVSQGMWMLLWCLLLLLLLLLYHHLLLLFLLLL